MGGTACVTSQTWCMFLPYGFTICHVTCVLMHLLLITQPIVPSVVGIKLLVSINFSTDLMKPCVCHGERLSALKITGFCSELYSSYIGTIIILLYGTVPFMIAV